MVAQIIVFEFASVSPVKNARIHLTMVAGVGVRFSPVIVFL